MRLAIQSSEYFICQLESKRDASNWTNPSKSLLKSVIGDEMNVYVSKTLCEVATEIHSPSEIAARSKGEKEGAFSAQI